jgi:membrane-anchored glycerophosphoryl diester phosphodiesterase (GDPDase)
VLDPVELTLRFMPARRRQQVEAFLRDFEWTWTKAVVFCLVMWFLAITFLGVIPSFWLYQAGKPPINWTQTHFWLFKARDLVAVILFSVPFGGFLVVPYSLQKKRRQLRSQSESRPTGGYR